MAAPRGKAQSGRTDAFNPNRPVKASLLLHPGDPVRALYEELVTTLGVSGAEVLRKALTELHKQQTSGRTTLQEAG